MRYFLHILSSDKSYPYIPAAIRSSIINNSFCIYNRRFAVVSSIDRFFFRMNCHVWDIQEGLINCYKACKLLAEGVPEHPIFRLWDSIRSHRW